MDLSSVLNAHIRNLYGSLGVDHTETAAGVGALNRDLKQAVPSFVGLQLVLVEHGHPVVLTEFDPTVSSDDIASSVRLPLPALGVAGADPASRIIFYAGTPGAFVDLAADTAFALRLAIRGPADGASEVAADPTAIVVDAPIQPSTLQSGLVGAGELSTINRAIGLLMGSGHPLPDARAELARLAAAAGVSVLACATQLLQRGSH